MRDRFRSHSRAKKNLAIAYHFARTSGSRSDSEFECRNCKRLKLHKGRNCKLYFPADWVTDRKEHAWFARYQHRDKWASQRKIPGEFARVESTVISECPTSLITPDSKRFLGEYFASTTAHREFGAIMYGSDPNRWPAWWFDVVSVLANAKNEAESIEMTE